MSYPTISDIQRVTAEGFGIPLIELMSRRNKRCRARQVAMYLSRELTPHSLPTIGRSFDRDHTTILHGIRRIEELAKSDPDFGERVASLKKQLDSS